MSLETNRWVVGEKSYELRKYPTFMVLEEKKGEKTVRYQFNSGDTKWYLKVTQKSNGKFKYRCRDPLTNMTYKMSFGVTSNVSDKKRKISLDNPSNVSEKKHSEKRQKIALDDPSNVSSNKHLEKRQKMSSNVSDKKHSKKYLTKENKFYLGKH